MQATPAGADDELTFEAMLEVRYPSLLRLAVLVARNRSDAEDAVQAALERAWRSRAQLRQPERLDGWLHRIVVREVLRRETSPWRRLVRGAGPTDLSWIPARAEDHDLRPTIGRALARLPPPQRAVVVLHHYAGYRVDEVAEIVDAPIETVRSRLRLAMARLRADLDR